MPWVTWDGYSIAWNPQSRVADCFHIKMIMLQTRLGLTGGAEHNQITDHETPERKYEDREYLVLFVQHC